MSDKAREATGWTPSPDYNDDATCQAYNEGYKRGWAASRKELVKYIKEHFYDYDFFEKLCSIKEE